MRNGLSGVTPKVFSDTGTDASTEDVGSCEPTRKGAFFVFSERAVSAERTEGSDV